MPQTDKIKRAILWIRKALEIKDPGTTQPGTVSGEILPTIDTFGWDRYAESINVNQSGVATALITSPVVPADVLRIILEASVNTGDDVQAFQLWLELVHSTPTSLRIGLQAPILLPVGNANVRVGLVRPVVLGPGDAISANANPATGAGLLLTLRTRHVDLPIGEYIQGL